MEEIKKYDNQTWKTSSPWNRIKDVFNIIGGMSFFVLLIINLNTLNDVLFKKPYDNGVVISCMNKYTGLSGELRRFNNGDTTGINVVSLMYRYFDLTNEELFYISKDMVDPDIGDDWMTGIMKELKLLNERDPNLYERLMKDYSRVRTTFPDDLRMVDVNSLTREKLNRYYENLNGYKRFN